MVSIKVLQLTHQVHKDGTCPILIRIIENRKPKYIKTGFAVKPSQFREGTENWVYKHNDSVLINLAIEKKRSAIFESAVMSDIEGKKFIEKKSQSFFKLMLQRQQTHELKNQVGAHAKLSSVIISAKAVWNDFKLEALTKDMVNQYVAYRFKEGIKINTIKKDLAVMSGVVASSDYEGKNYFHIVQSELKKEDPAKEKLSLDEIARLESTKLEGLADLARDMFLFSFYTHGMRFQNVAMMEEKMIKSGVITYRMNKGKKIREIEMHPKLNAIIKKYKGKSIYLFPVLKTKPKDAWEIKDLVGNANALINLNLKRAAVVCGIDKNISFHVSRHTFAFLSLKRGVNRSILKDALGHSSYTVTEMYLKSLSDDDINNAIKGLYD